MKIVILGSSIVSPIRLTTPLKLTDHDKRLYRWLASGDRYYTLERELGRGGVSVAVLGKPCDRDGVLLPNSPDVVIKFPNLDNEHLTLEINRRVDGIHEQSVNELALIRNKLFDCHQANPIFDMGEVWLQEPLRRLVVTVQEFMKDAIPLDEWLVQESYRAKITYDSHSNQIPWSGISAWQDWLRVVSLVANGLLDVHRRRVIHGDLWPPNIFVRLQPSLTVVFIDFGESFVVTPSGDPHRQRNHAYRAPERGKVGYVPTEQVDVYSLGKLMLYLAIGRNAMIAPELYGHARRNEVRRLLFEHNPNLVKASPRILDIIAQCTALDPVMRPRIEEICDQLKEADPNADPGKATSTELLPRLDKLSKSASLALDRLGEIFAPLLHLRIAQFEHLIDTCKTEMIQIDGTRDQLIRSLVLLFDGLSDGDSWSTLTSPAVWQDGALGLDGRYLTATVEALRRKTSVHRSYVVSVEELGADWSRKLVSQLDKSDLPVLGVLAKRLRRAVSEFELLTNDDSYTPQQEGFVVAHRERLLLVLQSLSKTIQDWELRECVFNGPFQSIKTTKGLFIGLIPVASLAMARGIRTENPVSLMYRSREIKEHDQWTLVMTDMRGRNEEDEPGSITRPQLRLVRVYKSAMGVPGDRILSLERILAGNAVNIGSVLEELFDCCKKSLG